MTITDVERPTITVKYCRLCGWLTRASWIAQELLITFAEELGALTLQPDDSGGAFEIWIDDNLIWSRKDMGRFPDMNELKQQVRDIVAPGRDLGHIDKNKSEPLE